MALAFAAACFIFAGSTTSLPLAVVLTTVGLILVALFQL